MRRNSSSFARKALLVMGLGNRESFGRYGAFKLLVSVWPNLTLAYCNHPTRSPRLSPQCRTVQYKDGRAYGHLVAGSATWTYSRPFRVKHVGSVP
jgi:hypothetical protein